MNEQELINIKRHIELERKLAKLPLKNMGGDEFIGYCFKNFSLSDTDYLISAYLMPIEEIRKELDRYDTSWPRLDELVFISGLSERFHVEESTIIQRIRDVRRINIVEKNLSDVKGTKKRKKVL